MFFAIEIEAHFDFRPEWYREGEVRALVLRYYSVLRHGLHAKPELRGCLTRCCHCRIYFLTHPRNAGRGDVRCPFGCRDAHRRECSARRSAAYYREREGREKKAAHNRNRYLVARAGARQEEEAVEPRRRVPTILRHVRMLVSLIEGRRVRWGEIARVLAQKWRQHPIGRWREVLYALRRLNKDPP